MVIAGIKNSVPKNIIKDIVSLTIALLKTLVMAMLSVLDWSQIISRCVSKHALKRVIAEVDIGAIKKGSVCLKKFYVVDP